MVHVVPLHSAEVWGGANMQHVMLINILPVHQCEPLAAPGTPSCANMLARLLSRVQGSRELLRCHIYADVL